MSVCVKQSATTRAEFSVTWDTPDAITNKRVPAGMICRQLVPSSGAKSTSLWDVTDPEALKQWLDETINVEVTHEVYEVQEEFAIGLGEIARARAAEKVVGGTKDVAKETGRVLGVAATTVGAQITEVDSKLRISERANAASVAIKESAVGRSAGAAFSKVGAALGTGTKKVLENDKVHSATEAVGSSFKRLGASLSSLTVRRSSLGRADSGEPAERTPQFVQTDDVSYDAPPGAGAAHTPAAALPAAAPVQAAQGAPSGGGMRNPAAAAPAAADAAPTAEEAKFALDENETLKP